MKYIHVFHPMDKQVCPNLILSDLWADVSALSASYKDVANQSLSAKIILRYKSFNNNFDYIL